MRVWWYSWHISHLATYLATHLRHAAERVYAGSGDACRAGTENLLFQLSGIRPAIYSGAGNPEGFHCLSNGVVHRQCRVLRVVQGVLCGHITSSMLVEILLVE